MIRNRDVNYIVLSWNKVYILPWKVSVFRLARSPYNIRSVVKKGNKNYIIKILGQGGVKIESYSTLLEHLFSLGCCEPTKCFERKFVYVKHMLFCNCCWYLYFSLNNPIIVEQLHVVTVYAAIWWIHNNTAIFRNNTFVCLLIRLGFILLARSLGSLGKICKARVAKAVSAPQSYRKTLHVNISLKVIEILICDIISK